MQDSVPIDPSAAAARAGVRIRAAEPSDIEAIAATLGDPGVVPGTLQVPYTSVEQRRARFRFDDPNVASLVAESLDNGTVIGNAGLHRGPGARRIHTATLGMSVSDAWQGRGVGTALLAGLLDIADNWWQIRRVHLEVFTDNEPAVALYRRFGFEVEGTLRGDAFRNGQYADTYVMGRIRAIA